MGSGYTVEGQKTGEEKHGGLQIEIIPSFETDLRTWIKDADATDDPENLQRTLPMITLDEHKTPLELGLAVGAKIRSYPQLVFEQAGCTMSDIVKDHELEGHVKVSGINVMGKC